jgi:hypothetical protein
MRRFIAYSLAESARFRTRLDTNSHDMTVAIGGMQNFGHHIWQELSGITQLLMPDRLSRVRGVLVGPHTWFRLDRVFPELSGIPVTTCANSEEMLVNGFSQPGTILRPVGVQITANLRSRLRRAAVVVLGPDEVRRICQAGADRRLIWINLRAHNKMWLTQVEGYSAILNALQSEFGDIGVVYDGWTDTAPIRDEIDQRLRPDIIRHDTIGTSIESSLIWADSVTTYISVVGSGLVLNSWLVHKPGMAHANRAHLNQGMFWNNVSQGMTPTRFIDAANVTCDGTLYGSYDFDWHLLIPKLRQILAA